MRIMKSVLSGTVRDSRLLAETIAAAPAGDLYVFAYGSLMWLPGFACRRRQAARIYGYSRRCAVFSTYYRGTDKKPGLVLGLDRGGSCNGVLYRVPRRRKTAVIKYLFDREMFAGVYHPRYITACAGGGRCQALTFVVRRDSRQYAAPMPPEAAAAIIAAAGGHGGSNRAYIYNTGSHLRQLGIPAPMLEQIIRHLPPAR